MTIYEKTCSGCRGTGRLVVANGSEDFDIVECGCKEEVITATELIKIINTMTYEFAI